MPRLTTPRGPQATATSELLQCYRTPELYGSDTNVAQPGPSKYFTVRYRLIRTVNMRHHCVVIRTQDKSRSITLLRDAPPGKTYTEYGVPTKVTWNHDQDFIDIGKWPCNGWVKVGLPGLDGLEGD